MLSDYHTRLPEYEDYLPELRDFHLRSKTRLINVFQLWNRQYIEGLVELLKPLPGPYLEVGAGDGVLSHWLREYGINYIATDNFSWKIEAVHPVEGLSVGEAIEKYHPRTAIASWAILEGTVDRPLFEAQIPNIITIGESNGGACGAIWDGYPERLGYERVEGFEFDQYNICCTDWFMYDRQHQHSLTILWRRKLEATNT